MNTRNYEIRAEENTLKLTGTAIVFGEPAKIGNVTEVISADALRGVDLSDVILLSNHNGGNIPLARTPQTMTLMVTDRGLEMSALLPDTEQGRSIHTAVKRGDLSKMSFAFDIGDSSFDEMTQTRTITKIDRIYEISVVNFAAYPQTRIEARKREENMFNPVTSSLEVKAENRDSHSTAEYRTAFFKNLLGAEMTDAETRAYQAARSEKRADSFNTLSNTAAVIPTATLNEIISQARPINSLLNEVRLFSVPSGLSVPTATPGNAAQWHTEGTAVERNSVSPSNVIFNAYELIKILSMSAAVKRMTLSAFEQYITDELSASIADSLGTAIVNGTGTGQPTGLLTGITWNSANSIETSSISAHNLLHLISMLPGAYAKNAKFAMSYATLFGKIYPLMTSTGEFIFADSKTGGVNRLFGFPIVIDDNIPVGNVIFGNFKYYGVNIPESVVIEVSRDSGFTSGLIDYRALCIADGKPILPDAFVKLTEETA
jgi:HK97 family phage major capsid protein